ncbi:hypothetical protein [Shinella sp.]|nr:hypothetical protein [Shinella sp.]MDX3974364.1 hypothetical protein [Shinella sp.]
MNDTVEALAQDFHVEKTSIDAQKLIVAAIDCARHFRSRHPDPG